MSQTSIKSDPTKTYCTLRETFDLVGKKVCGPKWQGFEADCDPARAKQQTDARSLRWPLAPDEKSFDFSKGPLPEPTRPIDGKGRAKLEQAIERYTKALNELLRLLHGGRLPTEFIPEGKTTVKEAITASDWPDPAKFDPINPTWNDLWFDIAADRVVLKSPETSPIPGRAQGEGSMWWAYGGRAGRVEIDREKLEGALKQYVRSKESEDSIAETTARNAKIQAAAEDIWREALKKDDRLTKEKVANRLLARSDADTLCRDLKKQDGGILGEDSLVRVISVPQWLPKRTSRKKDNRSSSRYDRKIL